jgi:hypothetical protein
VNYTLRYGENVRSYKPNPKMINQLLLILKRKIATSVFLDLEEVLGAMMIDKKVLMRLLTQQKL